MIWTIINTSINSRKERVNKSITESRIKWINDIRIRFICFIEGIDEISNKFSEEIFLKKTQGLLNFGMI